MSGSVDSASRLLRAAGAVMAAAAVALAAYASHGADALVRGNLQTAALFAFGHGLALATLARGPLSRLALPALGMLFVGALLFCGALVARSLFGASSTPAPFGGMVMILGWLLYAVAALRARD